MEVAEKFKIQTDSFQGPLELVIELIEKRKLLVNELALSQITDDFVQFIRNHPAFPIEDAADFIGVAATLLLIKSKSLLPELDLTEEESEDVEDLKRRLVVYEKAREAARELSALFGRNVMVSAGEKKPEPFFSPARDLSVATLESALRDALTSLEKEEKLPEVRVRPLVTIEEMMDRLTQRVQTALNLSFKEFAGSTAEKVEVIVSFLALLELVKQGAVDAVQQGAFGEINISNSAAAVPKYG